MTSLPFASIFPPIFKSPSLPQVDFAFIAIRTSPPPETPCSLTPPVLRIFSKNSADVSSCSAMARYNTPAEHFAAASETVKALGAVAQIFGAHFAQRAHDTFLFFISKAYPPPHVGQVSLRTAADNAQNMARRVVKVLKRGGVEVTIAIDVGPGSLTVRKNESF
jgi:hypothetical protein